MNYYYRLFFNFDIFYDYSRIRISSFDKKRIGELSLLYDDNNLDQVQSLSKRINLWENVLRSEIIHKIIFGYGSFKSGITIIDK